MKRNRKKILLLTDWFYPGYKGGGPIQSCRNFAAFMEDEYDLSIVTSDRDLGDLQSYRDIELNRWQSYSTNTRVYYTTALTLQQLNQLQHEIAPDYIYINSMFSRRYAVYPLWLKKTGKIKAAIILAPRGMLKKSARAFKASKKKIFFRLFRLLKMQELIHFHATDPAEVNDIREVMGKQVSVTLIPNFPGRQQRFVPPPKKTPGILSAIFVGRIHPIKNLDFILSCLQQISANVLFTIVAAIEDEQYWRACSNLIKQLPPNVKVDMKNDLPHDEMEHILQQHHLFCLPTKGENFGHAIFESLAAGRPVLISDQTPWRNLQSQQVGWDLPLHDQPAFIRALKQAAAMDEEELKRWCGNAWQYCYDFIKGSGIKEQYLKLFN